MAISRLINCIFSFGIICLICCEKEKTDKCNLIGYGYESKDRFQITYDYNKKAYLRKVYSLGIQLSPNSGADYILSQYPYKIDSVIYNFGSIKVLYKYYSKILMEHDEYEYDEHRIITKKTYDHYNREEPILARVQEYEYDNRGLLCDINYIIYQSPGNITYISDTLYKKFYYDSFRNLVKTITISYFTNDHDSAHARYYIEEFSDYDNNINPFYGMPFQDLFRSCYYEDGYSIYDLPDPSVFIYSALSINNFRRYTQIEILAGDTTFRSEISRSFDYNENGYPIIGKYYCD